MKERVSSHVDNVSAGRSKKKQVDNLGVAIHAGIVKWSEAMLIAEEGAGGGGGRT